MQEGVGRGGALVDEMDLGRRGLVRSFTSGVKPHPPSPNNGRLGIHSPQKTSRLSAPHSLLLIRIVNAGLMDGHRQSEMVGSKTSGHTHTIPPTRSERCTFLLIGGLGG
ncbi:hypothetical protein BHE74_00005834 [Ensete ventricosum]|nr:hypothetical protein BHE74_00005834 [Ensete ventricosum]